MTNTQTDRELDAIERLLDVAGLTSAAEQSVFKTYGEKGYAAAVGAIQGQKVTTRLKATLKAAPADVIDAALERLRVAATGAAKSAGDTTIAKMIEGLAAQLGGPVTAGAVLTDSGVQSKSTTKAAEPFNPWRDWTVTDDFRPR
jgi:hypothetical protein